MANLDGVKFAVLSESDSGQILELINRIQPAMSWTPEHLRWQFFETPAGQARLYGVRDSRGSLIAFYAAVAQRIRLGNRLVPARMVQDVMTHPDHRGRGFLHGLAGRCYQDMVQANEVGYTFPNEKSERSFRRTGWSELCSVPLRRKAVRPLSVSKQNATMAITQIDRDFGDIASSIWNSSGLAVGVNRDTAYFNWRYNKPTATYFKFLVNASEGLMVLKLYQDGQERPLHICELITSRGKTQNVAGMLEFCERFGTQTRASTITAWLPPEHPYNHAFNEFGLEITPGVSRYIFVHPGQGYANELANPGLWHWSQGDSDIY